MIKINQLSKSYFARELFTDVTFQMNVGDRLGLVGRNGHGKSTLLASRIWRDSRFYRMTLDVSVWRQAGSPTLNLGTRMVLNQPISAENHSP